MAIAGKVAAIHKESGASAAFVDAATTANATYTRYTITNAANRYLDRNVAVTVKKNSVIQTTGFTIEYAGGVVVFAAALAPTDTVTVSGNAFPMAQVGGAFNWSLDLELETEDVTTFASGGWREVLPTLKGFSGSAEMFWLDGSFFSELTSPEGAEMVLVFYVDSGPSKLRYEGYARLAGVGVETPVDAIVRQTLEFTGDGPLYYREG